MLPAVAWTPRTTRVPRRALVVSRHAATVRTAGVALGAVGLPRRVVGDLAQLPSGAAEDYGLAIVDLDVAPELEPVEIVARVALACPGAAMIAVAGTDARRRLLVSLGDQLVGHALPKLPLCLAPLPDGASSESVVDFSAGPDERDLFVALRRRTDPSLTSAPGVAPYLGGAAAIHERWLGSSSDKEDALEEVLALGERMQLHGEKLRRIETLADELLLNALFDAPVDETGAPRYANLERRQVVTLAPSEQVRIRYGCDGRAFAIAVADRFGSLARSTVIERLSHITAPGTLRTARDRGGAGVGLVMAFGAANQLSIAVAARQSTEIVAVVDIAGNNRTSAERGTSLHLYFDEEKTA